MTSILKNIFVVLGLIIVGGLGYYLFVQNPSLIGLSSGDVLLTQNEANSTDFLRRLNELQKISLNQDIFTDLRFTTLVDHSTPIESFPVGRQNPFQSTN